MYTVKQYTYEARGGTSCYRNLRAAGNPAMLIWDWIALNLSCSAILSDISSRISKNLPDWMRLTKRWGTGSNKGDRTNPRDNNSGEREL